MLVELHTLGHCLVAIGDERLGPQSPFAFAVALYLGVERGRPHTREQLLPLFFPGVPEANAAHSLRQTLYKLRQLGFPAETTPAGTLVAATDVRDDYSRLLATGELPDPDAQRLPGEFLPGYWPRLSDEYTRWLEGQRDAVNGALRRAYVSRILDRRAVARWDEVERYARACLAIDPLNEEATLALAEALALSGSKAAGVKVLDAYLAEVGGDSRLCIPAGVLKKRIAERVRPRPAPHAAPLFGREQEMRLLNQALGDCRAGTQRVAHVSGEPGIGKSRLAREFVSAASLAGVRSLTVACQPTDGRRPMSVFAEIASDLIKLPGALGCSPDEISLVKRLYTYDPGVLDADTQLEADSAPIDVSGRITSAISRILDAVTAETTLVFLVEDLQWADEPSRRTLAALTSDRKQRRLLILATSRNPAGLDLPEAVPIDVIQLTGLPNGEARALAARQINDMGVDALDRELYADAAVRVSGGNPFALLSLSRHYAATRNIDAVPPQLHQLIAAQLRSLPEAAKQVLVAVTILDRHATVERVKLALEIPTHALVSGIGDLERRGLISFRDSRITPPHALLIAALLTTEPEGALAVVRQSVAERLSEEAERAGDARLYWAAADHWRQAGHPEKSVETLVRCAEHGISIGAARDVMSVLRQLQTLAPHTSTTRAIDHVCSLLTQTPHLWGDIDTSLSVTSDGSASGDLTQLRLLEVAAVHAVSGSALDRIDWLKSVISDARRSPTERMRAAMNALVESEQTLDAATAHWVHRQVKRHLPSAAADDEGRNVALIYHSTFGDIDEGIAIARDTIAELSRGRPGYRSLRSMLNAANVLERAGLVLEAIAATETVYRVGRAAQSAGSMQRAASSLAYLFRTAGDGEASDEWIAVSADVGCHSHASAYRNAHYHVSALRAIDREDYQRADDYLRHLDARPPARTNTLQWALIEAIRIHVAAGLEMAMSDAAVQALTEWSLIAARWYPQDDVAAAVCICLRSKHGDARADRYIARYEECRRKTQHAPIPWATLRARRPGCSTS